MRNQILLLLLNALGRTIHSGLIDLHEYLLLHFHESEPRETLLEPVDDLGYVVYQRSIGLVGGVEVPPAFLIEVMVESFR